MTPDELKQYVDQALKHRDEFTVVYLLLVPIISIGGSWLISYLKEKGKNTATKEDVGVITGKIESAKSSFATGLEKLKTELASRSYYNKVRYEHEMEFFRAITPKLHALRVAVAGLRPALDYGLKEGETEEQRKERRLQLFGTVHSEFVIAMETNRPFYPPEIWKALLALQNLCHEEAVHFNAFEPSNQQDYWTKAIQNRNEIEKQVDKVYEAIRKRLTDFDQA